MLLIKKELLWINEVGGLSLEGLEGAPVPGGAKC